MAMLWFEIPYVSMIVFGFVLSAYFIVTWWRGVTNKRSLEAFDAGGWVMLLLFALTLVLVNMWVYGIPDIQTTARGLQALAIYAVLDAVLIVRVIVWNRIRKMAIAERSNSEVARSVDQPGLDRDVSR